VTHPARLKSAATERTRRMSLVRRAEESQSIDWHDVEDPLTELDKLKENVFARVDQWFAVHERYGAINALELALFDLMDNHRNKESKDGR